MLDLLDEKWNKEVVDAMNDMEDFVRYSRTLVARTRLYQTPGIALTRSSVPAISPIHLMLKYTPGSNSDGSNSRTQSMVGRTVFHVKTL